MKKTLNLVDDFQPGGIRSLLEDMSNAGIWPSESWQVRTVNPCMPIRLDTPCDVIVVHYAMAWRKLSALTALRLRHPRAQLVIVEHHYTASFERHHVPNVRRFRQMLRLSYRLADRVVAVSAAQARWMRRASLVDNAKVETIPACRDYSRFLAIPRVGKKDGPMVIGALGRLVPTKGFDLLIRAFARLPAEDFRLRIAGDGEQRDELEALAEGLEHVEFVGHLDDPAPFLAECDVLAVPSRHEAFGLVCAEGKAAGLPVIVSDVDGLPEQAHDCGVVVETGNVEALREAIVHVARPSRLERYRGRARKSVVNAWSQYLTAWSALLA